MNCKPGDLAVVVRSEVGNTGKVCRCIRLATQDETRDFKSLGPMWVTDRTFISTWGDADHFMFDAFLRPIRDNDGEDETLRYAGKPADNMRKEVQALTDKLNAALERLRQVERREGQGA